MTLTAAGSLGIGTTSPTTKTQITTNLGGTNPSTYTDVLTIGVSNGQDETGKPNIGSGLVFNGIEYYNQQFALARITAQKTSADWNGFLTFHTNPGNQDGTTTERMRIWSSGNVNIGTTPASDAGYKLDVNGTGRFSGNVTVETATPLFVLQASTTGTFHGIEFRQGAGLDASIKQLPASGELRISSGRSVGWGGDISFYTDTVLALSISNTGTALFASSVTASSFFESSDSRLKTLIQDNYQTKGIASITPKLYTKNGKVELGYYAQDFVGILDSAVSKGSDDMLSLSYREVLVAKVYALEQEIKELKAKLN
jgi:hypothetical protein